MGVKNLWQILTPFGNKTSLISLQDKQVALDLSCWVCENQLVADSFRSMQSKMHLRNIFFRLTILLLFNIKPLFVLDGDPPDIKQGTLCKRIQNKSKQKQDTSKKVLTKKGKRKQHAYALKECEEMLHLLGLICIWSSGEGEALCAQLDKEGVVDGVITQDSDAFLYGARKVYRNFTIQGGCGSVEVYEMSDIENQMNLSREKLIAMSLLCGCDYDGTGVLGIGSERSLKYLSNFKGDILKRLHHIKDDEELKEYAAEKNNCKKCRHPGKLRDHSKFGCKDCKTESACRESLSRVSFNKLTENERNIVDFELRLREKVMLHPQFPDNETISEYLNFKQEIYNINVKWKKPDIEKFIEFMEEKCGWCKCYGFEKVTPLCCRWALLNSDFSDYMPVKILKKRVLKGVPCFEVEWILRINRLVLMCSMHENNNLGKSITSIEPQVLIKDKCELLYEDYTNSLLAKKLMRKKGKRENAANKKVKNSKKDLGSNNINKLVEEIDQLKLGNVLSDTGENYCEMITKIKTDCQEIGKDFGCKNSDRLNISQHEKENCFREELDSSTTSTIDYDPEDYEMNESLILNNIIARREFY